LSSGKLFLLCFSSLVLFCSLALVTLSAWIFSSFLA
jgi:hypothetical protein